MAKKNLTYRGKTEEELKVFDLKQFSGLVSSRIRRSLKRGFTEEQKKFLAKLKKAKEGKWKKTIKTHCRDMIIIPEMLGHNILVHQGKEWVAVNITFEHLGRYLGEFTVNRKKVKHSAPGIGATRSSASMSVK